MTAWGIAVGILLALAVGFLMGYRAGVNDGVRQVCAIFDELDADKAMLRRLWAAFQERGFARERGGLARGARQGGRKHGR